MKPTGTGRTTNGIAQAPLPVSGLPPRILAVLRSQGLATLNDLPEARLPTGVLDADDRAWLARVGDWCRQAFRGHPPILPLTDWLATFLPPRLADAIRIHYALDDSSAAIALHQRSLRDSGFELGVSRERARQLLRDARHALCSSLPLYAAEPIYAAADQALAAAGGVLDPTALARTQAPAWKGASAVGAFLLLADLTPERIVLYRGFFSRYSDHTIERIELALRDRLNLAEGPLTLAEIEDGLPATVRSRISGSCQPLIQALLRHMPDTLAARDGRGGLADRAAPGILREILLKSGESPLPRIAEVFNERMHPECRRGSGTLRRWLDQDPLVHRTRPGRYALQGGLQTDLPLATPRENPS